MNNTQKRIFQILTYLLLPIGLFFGVMGVGMLFLAIVNTQILLPVFMLACFAIYVYCSHRFLQKINAHEQISKSLRDWMRVNAYVCVFMSILFVMNTAVIIYLPSQKLEGFLQPSLDSMGNLANGLSIEKLTQQMKSFSVFLLILCILLLVHIFLNFRLQRMQAAESE